MEKIYIIQPITEDNAEKYRVLQEEAVSLIESAGAAYAGTIYQNVREINPATFIGEGKLRELKERLYGLDEITVLFNGELSPSQTLNISAALDNRKVIDRTTLILDIFAKNAQSSEGKLQVELAQLKYIYPRLKGKGEALSRLGGGVGTRGPGETQLETDRRYIRGRLKYLEQRLRETEKRRSLQTVRRKKDAVKTIALVGYTNTGKSTLLNLLTGSDVYVKNELFATLDPTARSFSVNDAEFLLVDTVGFLQDLPHNLIEAFKSTLEEAAFAYVIVNVADAGDAQAAEQLAVTDEVLGSLDCTDIPQLVVYNKCDTANTVAFDPDILLTSAKTGYGLPALLAKLDEVLNHRVRTIEIVLPYDKLALADILRSRGSVAAEEYREDGVYYRGTVKIDDLHRFEEFLV